MKTSFTLFLILVSNLFSFLHATNYTNSGNSQSYNLNNGDTLRITAGTFSGNINTFTYNAVITVSAGATFKPNNFNTPGGKIVNYGTCEFGSLGTYSQFKFENYNLLIVKGDLSLYDGNTQTWNNNPTATIKINGSFYMNNAAFTNYATITVGNNFAMYTATSNFTNRGLLTIAGDLSISNGLLDNENRIVADDVNAWGGQVINEGEISPKGNMTFSAGTNYTNRCLLITNAGFTNYGNFTNNGLLWVGRTGTASDHFYNSGTFTNAADAVVRTVKLTNYSNLAGSGGYYITGESYTSGTVGKAGTTTDTIKIYDASRSSASRIFDTQWGTVHPNVVFRPFAQPDTTAVNYTGCSSYYKTNISTLLPVEWNYFDVKQVQNKPALSWSAQFEANMKFEVERSIDNVSFKGMATLLSNSTAKYSFVDAYAEKNAVIYYRIKAISANGTMKYSETKSVKTNNDAVTSLSISPNPVKNVANILYQSPRSEQVTIRVSNVNGQRMFTKNQAAVSGDNLFILNEASNLSAGIYFVEITTASLVTTTERFVKN